MQHLIKGYVSELRCDLSKCQTFYKQQYKPQYDPKTQRANSVRNIGSIKKITNELQSRLLRRFLKVNIPPSFSKKTKAWPHLNARSAVLTVVTLSPSIGLMMPCIYLLTIILD